MIEIIGVKFSSAGRVYYFEPKGVRAEVGAMVLVETARGVEMGRVVISNKQVEDNEIIQPLKPIIRLATEADFKQAEENKEKEKEAFRIALEKIAEHKLEMKLVDAEYTFDRSKILFYFTADGRVDFRELVKSLASVFRTRIELRQIGVRDEARQIGSLGICGRPLCCSTFLNDFHPVSIKMAKEQGLSLNPTKISGVCGRLMCCLQYEQNAYEDMLKRMPRRGSKIQTPDGEAIVADTETLKGRVKVKFVDERGETLRFDYYVLEDLDGTGGGAPKFGRERKTEIINPIPMVTPVPEEEPREEPKKKPKRRNHRGGQKKQKQGDASAPKAAQENNAPKQENPKPNKQRQNKPKQGKPDRNKQGKEAPKQENPKQNKPESPKPQNGGYGAGY